MSDSETNIIRELFAREIPEVADCRVQIMAIVREPGFRSKVALKSMDDALDSVAACVGLRGNRIKKVIDAIDGERIDLVRWNDDLNTLIRNALQPAEVHTVVLDEVQCRATVFVATDQHSLVSGRHGINQRLAGALCGYEIVVETM